MDVIYYQVELCEIRNKRRMFLHLVNIIKGFYQDMKIACCYEGGNMLSDFANVYESVAHPSYF
jgi:hypothetical protein